MTGSVGSPRLAASETLTGGEWEAPAPQKGGPGMAGALAGRREGGAARAKQPGRGQRDFTSRIVIK